MLKEEILKQILFVDIETVPQLSEYKNVSDKMKILWNKKSEYFRKENQTPEDVYQRAGIYAEFGKIVCISAGVFIGKESNYSFKLRSFYGDNEQDILTHFSEMILKLETSKEIYLCAHNGKEFDYPYIARRMLINSIQLPQTFEIAGKKPWEVKHLDTLELWKFGDYKHYTSLDLLTTIFNIPSPKEEIDGSMVADVFYIQKDIKKIMQYCENDVVAIAQLMLRYLNKPLIESSNIFFSN